MNWETSSLSTGIRRALPESANAIGPLWSMERRGVECDVLWLAGSRVQFADGRVKGGPGCHAKSNSRHYRYQIKTNRRTVSERNYRHHNACRSSRFFVYLHTFKLVVHFLIFKPYSFICLYNFNSLALLEGIELAIVAVKMNWWNDGSKLGLFDEIWVCKLERIDGMKILRQYKRSFEVELYHQSTSYRNTCFDHSSANLWRLAKYHRR